MRAIYACILACIDYRREPLLSLCAILSTATILAPLLILYGVKFGIIQTLSDRLSSDPTTLEISPIGSGHYSLDWITKTAESPAVAFILPRTRTIAATINIAKTRLDSGIAVPMEPTAVGDPLLLHYHTEIPQIIYNDFGPNTKSFVSKSGVVLSESLARKLNINIGDTLVANVDRNRKGSVQRAYLNLNVVGILPLSAEDRDYVFIPLLILEAAEDFRDGRAHAQMNREDGWDGEEAPFKRIYTSFRLYAKDFDAVISLRDALNELNVETYTKAHEIEQVKTLSNSLTIVFALISIAAAIGFAFSTASSSLANVKRKERIFGLLRLQGLPRYTLLLFPLCQSFLTACLGTLVAVLLYEIAASIINWHFAYTLVKIEKVCQLLPSHFVIALIIAIACSILPSFLGAIKAADIEPAEVIRDV